MFRPKYPAAPVVPTVPAVVEQQHTAPPCGCQHAPPPARPALRLSPTGLLVAVGGGTSVVLVVGTVLVSMLLAVAISAASVAICAVVLRSLLSNQHTHR
ncbi:SpdD-like protein [Streptomyces sp. WAC 06738]|uniref:SpdD-like protein n=1 Tax=Streptomyces sp. WAC 06738 TaxID=2203210 RepID=UPI000F6D98F9|nr:SpdD-like protein [Streptomyces sp. WAC 06738]AZM47505.1 SpdD-like protein [Streptomyces sp. WAC 06738]